MSGLAVVKATSKVVRARMEVFIVVVVVGCWMGL